ncbi:hypothetical protein SASPL_138063 [Salvia splendens]|uniref:C2H2-type domain-containing protein n=1 Tax=Salvia splendens TaxID=180675 RepID=A0A8X8WVZ2_SALSN|nr:hypothetical protein SASPL_138063 [Salvia splendens]
MLRNLKEGHQEVHCSRERSRAAWKIIEEYLTPFVEKEKYQLPSRCRLHPSSDLFRDQEEHKTHFDINDWRCGYCKKIFRAEKYLDQHFDNRHYNLLNVVCDIVLIFSVLGCIEMCIYMIQLYWFLYLQSHGKCLADLCGALHCDYVINSQLHKAKCTPGAASRNRHLCEDLANNCFPVNKGPSATRLHVLRCTYLFKRSKTVLSGRQGMWLLLEIQGEKRNDTAHARSKTWEKTKTLLMESGE